MNRHTVILLFLPLSAFFSGGCGEKGCTDPKAVNYNSVATEDDGSCIICQSTHGETGRRYTSLVDYNSSSIHYMDVVAEFTARQLTNSYSHGLCGEKQCSMEISIRSLITQNMQIYYQLSCSGDIYFNQYRSVNISPHDTLVVDTIAHSSMSNPCGRLDMCSLSATASGTIYYW